MAVLENRILKVRKNCHFKAKPETGQNMSGKKFVSGIFFLSVDFKYTFIFLIDKDNPKIWTKWCKLVTTTTTK